MKILVTGSAGYIGSLIVNRLIEDRRVTHIICIDLLPQPIRIMDSPRLIWIQTDLAENGWEEKVDRFAPIDAVVHSAFKIRNPFGKIEETKKNNLDACRNTFRFAFSKNIARLIYLSSVAAYAARPENVGTLIKEDAPLRETVQPYGAQKKMTEEILTDLFRAMRPATSVSVLRLNSVTGPLGQSLRSKFGLITGLKRFPFILEASSAWARQFVHEKDVEEIIIHIVFKENAPRNALEVFNIAPAQFLTARDMGKLLGHVAVHIPAWLLRAAFAVAWPLSLGKIPTPPGSLAGFIYPINVDGTKIEKLGFRYRYTAEDAFLGRV